MFETMDKNDEAWQRIFADLHLKVEESLSKTGRFIIDSKTLKRVSEREPRLMTKFDHYKNLPKCFRDNQLSIMPISRYQYQLGRCEMYHRIETYPQLNEPIRKVFLNHLESLDIDNIHSEQVALAVASMTSMIDDFLGEKTYLTLQGRMASGNFSFQMHHILDSSRDTLTVNNSQLEIDASYEGGKSIAVFEAKLGICDDFLIRQLYYPFRMLCNNKIDKKIRLVFFCYSDKVYYFYEYGYSSNEYQDYNAIQLLRAKSYTLEARPKITIDCLKQWIAETKPLPEPEVPFPQANSFVRIIDLLGLCQNETTKEEITENYDFDPRQADYYVNGGIYLGLIERTKSSRYQTTSAGKRILELPYFNRQKAFVQKMMEHVVFRKILLLYLDNGLKEPDEKTLLSIMHSSGLFKVHSEDTYKRRLSTIKKWISRILDSLKKK